MKRLRAAIICVCMLSVFLGGCGQTETVVGDAAKTAQTAPTRSAAADSLTVEPYQIGTGDLSSPKGSTKIRWTRRMKRNGKAP